MIALIWLFWEVRYLHTKCKDYTSSEEESNYFQKHPVSIVFFLKTGSWESLAVVGFETREQKAESAHSSCLQQRKKRRVLDEEARTPAHTFPFFTRLAPSGACALPQKASLQVSIEIQTIVKFALCHIIFKRTLPFQAVTRLRTSN